MDDKLTREGLRDILAFLPLFEDKSTALYTYEEGTGFDPWRYSDDFLRFMKTLHDTGFVIAFDWTAWRDEARRVIQNLDSADLDSLRKLTTAHIRQDRFFGGYLAELIDNGHLRDILRRLQQLYDEIE